MAGSPDSTARARQRPWLSLLADLVQDRAGLLGLCGILLIGLMALFAPWVAPHDPSAQDVIARLRPPVWLPNGSWDHILGTDHLGRDVLSRMIWGARATLFIGISVVLLSGAFGVAVGLVAGYVGGRTDSLLMRLVDIQMSLPGILLILLIVSVIGPGVGTLIVVLAFLNWMIYARLVRGMVMSLRQTPYVEAAEIVGCRPHRVIIRHILPNLISPLLTLGILEFTNIVLAEAAVSFLGLGVQPPETSWGLDVAAGRDYLFVAWWLITFPGLCIVATVLSVNLFAGWVRVTADPKERSKQYALRRGRRALPSPTPASPAQ